MEYRLSLRKLSFKLGQEQFGLCAPGLGFDVTVLDVQVLARACFIAGSASAFGESMPQWFNYDFSNFRDRGTSGDIEEQKYCIILYLPNKRV